MPSACGARPDVVMSERQVGSAAEEAAKLFSAVEDWARTRAGGLLDSEHLATGSPECLVCPLCQAIGAARLRALLSSGPPTCCPPGM